MKNTSQKLRALLELPQDQTSELDCEQIQDAHDILISFAETALDLAQSDQQILTYAKILKLLRDADA
jgi:hypothetical protein